MHPSSGQPGEQRARFAARASVALPEPLVSAPSDREALSDELNRIDDRIRRTAADGRNAFFEGSDSYDRAVVAVIRLAALFEDEESQFGELLAVATKRERTGITHTRNIAAHRGYAVMNDDQFWETVTTDVPAFIEKLRTANNL